LARWDSLLAEGKGVIQDIFSVDKLRLRDLAGSRHVIVSGPVQALERALAADSPAAQSREFRVIPNYDVVATTANVPPAGR
jgi:hypothetical protein